jgi:hypothetical protein
VEITLKLKPLLAQFWLSQPSQQHFPCLKFIQREKWRGLISKSKIAQPPLHQQHSQPHQTMSKRPNSTDTSSPSKRNRTHQSEWGLPQVLAECGCLLHPAARGDEEDDGELLTLFVGCCVIDLMCYFMNCTCCSSQRSIFVWLTLLWLLWHLLFTFSLIADRRAKSNYFWGIY